MTNIHVPLVCYNLHLCMVPGRFCHLPSLVLIFVQSKACRCWSLAAWDIILIRPSIYFNYAHSQDPIAITHPINREGCGEVQLIQTTVPCIFWYQHKFRCYSITPELMLVPENTKYSLKHLCLSEADGLWKWLSFY